MTELIQKILTSPAAQRMVSYVSPIYGDAYVALSIYQTMGLEYDELQEWEKEFYKHMLPQTATAWGLDYWEDQYSISHDYTLTLEQRRKTLLSKVRERAPMNPEKIRKIAEIASGFKCRVAENVSKNKFAIYISGYNVPESKVRAAVDRAKPARLLYDVNFEQGLQSNFYYGGTVRIAKKFTIRQVV